MSMLNALIHESGAEVLKNLRAPEFLLPSLIMPVGFFTLFAVAIPGTAQQAPYMLATFGVFSVMGPAIFGFGAGVANERERGWLNLKRAVPAPALSYLGAKVFSTLLFALAALSLVYIVAGFVAGVELQRSTWATLFAAHLMSAVPFVFLGLALGFLFSTNGAVAIANILFLLLSALGGLWIPIFVLPKFLQEFAVFLPSFHLGEIAVSVVQADAPIIPKDHVLVIGIMTILLSLVAFVSWMKQRS